MIAWLVVIVPWLVGIAVMARRTARGMRRAWRDVYRPMITGR